PPPPSTLFPYTTLFRSGVPTHPAFCHGEQPGSLAHVNQGTFREGLTFARIVPKLQDSFRFLVFAWAIPLPIALDVRSGFHLRLRDRKSTRLNSSHLGIS